MVLPNMIDCAVPMLWAFIVRILVGGSGAFVLSCSGMVFVLAKI